MVGSLLNLFQNIERRPGCRHDFGPAFAAEKRREGTGLDMSVSTLRRTLITEGLREGMRRKKRDGMISVRRNEKPLKSRRYIQTRRSNNREPPSPDVTFERKQVTFLLVVDMRKRAFLRNTINRV
jgi:hypothetical protein